MNPRLAALSEPLRGKIIEPGGGDLSVGRHQSNDLRIRQLTVSRHHCLFQGRAEGMVLRDLESSHGTFVNGTPIKERLLAHGDLITVGDSMFLYLVDEPESPANEDSIVLDDGVLVTGTTVEARLEDLTPPTGQRATHDLEVLLRLSRAVHSIHAVEPLACRLLDLVFELTPADRGAVLLTRPGGDEIAHSFTRQRHNQDGPWRVSRTIVQRVLEQNVALRCDDVLTTSDLDAESLRSARVRSLICVPLPEVNRCLGALYLDIVEGGGSLDDQHLQLVMASAGIASSALANARYVEWLESENRRLRTAADHDMVGESPEMRKLYRLISRVAPSDATVLIRGESGTGKELVARAIHRGSPRTERAFVALNCATLSETLLESDLFGHEKGAFTGAVARKTGKIEVADGGTLFLDEVGELPTSLQAKLLRVLQERELERVGGTRPIAVDIRVLAATNRDLEKAIREGTFREDLFYRINVISLRLPPLRERGEDVALLASHFLAQYSQKLNRRVAGLSPEARCYLEGYEWPGNVRELANAIERAIVLGDGELVRPEDLPETVLESKPSRGTSIAKYHEAIRHFKKELILDAVKRTDGNITRAAKQLGVNANYLHRLLHKLDLRAAIP